MRNLMLLRMFSRRFKLSTTRPIPIWTLTCQRYLKSFRKHDIACRVGFSPRVAMIIPNAKVVLKVAKCYGVLGQARWYAWAKAHPTLADSGYETLQHIEGLSVSFLSTQLAEIDPNVVSFI
jgi:hypothetical protein